MFLDSTVKVTISNNNKIYLNKGYGDHKQGDVIFVKIEDLPKKSIRKVLTKCDDCDLEWMACYSNMIKTDHHRCFKCTRKYVGKKIDQTKASARNRERIGEKHPRWRFDKPEFKNYHRLVTRITNKQPLSRLKDFDKRGLAGRPGAFHLDHKISVYYGYENKISPEIIGSIENLEMIPWESNYAKREKCSLSLGELFMRIELSHQTA